ncbi:MAG: FAD-dependent oxidoreductase [Chloroflexi bacterium]|nr:FAD-dependent oxidoreductase [Chloroflexota bacterium]
MGRIVLIGGGVIGLCTALALDRRGARVTVIEAAEPGRGASHGNAGWIVPSLSGPVPGPGILAASLKWMLRSDSPLYIKPRADPSFARWLLAFWRHCNAADHHAGFQATFALGSRTMALFDELAACGIPFEYHRTGILFVHRLPGDLQRHWHELSQLRAYGYAPELLEGDALRAREPALVEGLAGGIFVGNERHVRVDTLMSGLVEHLLGRGVEIRRQCPVVGFERTGPIVRAVRTADGPVEADQLVICAGAWTAAVARLVGASLPVEAAKGYSIDFMPPPLAVSQPIYLHEPRVAVTPLDGAVRLAGTMELSGVNDRILDTRVEAILRAPRRYLRGWPADAPHKPAWSGLRPLAPDGIPVIGPIPGLDNLFVASGHGMLGVSLGPATGEAVAEMLLSGRPPAVLEPFSPARFRRG